MHQTVMGELGQFLDPDTGVSQGFDDRTGPERLVLLHGEIAAAAGIGGSAQTLAAGFLVTNRLQVCPAAVNWLPGAAACAACSRSAAAGMISQAVLGLGGVGKSGPRAVPGPLTR
ncbi:hypothetical protein ABZ907_44285 [Nonomuraea wenchangensis]